MRKSQNWWLPLATSLMALFCVVPMTHAQIPPPEPIEAPGPLAPLRGTLQRSQEDNGPVALILPGSGPTDRDGNNPLGIRAAMYKLLADGLAERGIATVRIDKRGMFSSLAAVSDGDAVTIGDYATDTNAWISVIRARTGQSCVWIIGHSEGGLVAMSAAVRGSNICGLVLIATPGRPLGSVLREQFQANPANAPILPVALATIDQLEAGKTVDTSGMHPALIALFRPSVQKFLISTFAIDPARLLAGCDKPILLLQGERDIQVSMTDAKLLAAANARTRLVYLPTMNHVLKEVVSDDRVANIATYADPHLPLAPGLADTIAQFISAGSASAK
jgi:pimeloyl-ACP methyl ester carboxylesterase